MKNINILLSSLILNLFAIVAFAQGSEEQMLESEHTMKDVEMLAESKANDAENTMSENSILDAAKAEGAMLENSMLDSDDPRAIFDKILKSHVVDGAVDYASISPDELQPYLDFVANMDVSKLKTTQEQVAFYVNAYNALSIKGILNGKSPSSLLGRLKFFKRVEYVIAGESMDLYDFEHKIIRPLGEPRIHFALVCASKSCPKLRSERYDVSRLDAQLDENAIDFVNDTTKNQFDTEKNKARLSKIFEWFTEDFVTDERTLQQYIAPYVKDESVAAILQNNGFKIKHLEYDWSLNGTK